MSGFASDFLEGSADWMETDAKVTRCFSSRSSDKEYSRAAGMLDEATQAAQQ